MNESKKDLSNTYDEVAELDDEFFLHAELKEGEKLIRPGRPKSASVKQPVTIRLDAPIVEYFKSTGKGWQTRMNDALNQWIKEHANA
jgi:uncharacterized protein (DUF4415 family)